MKKKFNKMKKKELSFNELISKKLLSNGWISESIEKQPDIDLQFAYKNAGNHIVIDHILKNKMLQLWFIGSNDKACYGFKYTDNLEKILDTIISIQNELKYENHFKNYSEIKKVFEVTIICWEQSEDDFDEFDDEEMQEKLIQEYANQFKKKDKNSN